MREASSRPLHGLRRPCEVALAAHQSHWNFLFYPLISMSFVSTSFSMIFLSFYAPYPFLRLLLPPSFHSIVRSESSSILPRYLFMPSMVVELELVLVRT